MTFPIPPEVQALGARTSATRDTTKGDDMLTEPAYNEELATEALKMVDFLLRVTGVSAPVAAFHVEAVADRDGCCNYCRAFREFWGLTPC